MVITDEMQAEFEKLLEWQEENKEKDFAGFPFKLINVMTFMIIENQIEIKKLRKELKEVKKWL